MPFASNCFLATQFPLTSSYFLTRFPSAWPLVNCAAHLSRWEDPAAFRTSRDSSSEISCATMSAAFMVWKFRPSPNVDDVVDDDVAVSDDAIRRRLLDVLGAIHSQCLAPEVGFMEGTPVG